MRLALITRHLNPHGDDAEQAVTRLGVDLARRGHDVTFLAATAYGPAPAGCRLLLQHDKFKPDPANRGGLLRRNPRGPDVASYLIWVRQQQAQGGFDADFSVDPLVPARVVEPRRLLAVSLSLQASREQPLGARVRASLQRHRLVRELALEQASLSDPRIRHVIAVSQLMAAALTQHHPLTARQLVALPDAIVPSTAPPHWASQMRTALNTPADSQVILWPWHHATPRQVAMVLDVLERLGKQRPTLLWIVGPNRYRLHQMIVSRHLRAVVRLLGETRQLALACEAADVTLHLPGFAASSAVVRTSLAAGTPSVTTDRDGAGELLASDCGGVAPWSTDANGLTNALGKLLKPDRHTACKAAIQQRLDDAAPHARVERIEQLLHSD